MRFLLPMMLKPHLLAPCLLIPALSLSACVQAALLPTIVSSTHGRVTIRFCIITKKSQESNKALTGLSGAICLCIHPRSLALQPPNGRPPPAGETTRGALASRCK